MIKQFQYITIFLCSISIFAQNPMVNIHLLNGSDKSYNLADINNITVNKGVSTFSMEIFTKDFSNDSYVTSNLDSIKFESINNTFVNLVIYKTGSSGIKYELAKIDSIIFTEFVAPQITSILPNSAKIGDIISINGSNFGWSRGNSFVSFASADATEYKNWMDNLIQVKVPVGATSGYITATVNGIKSNSVGFTVSVAPSITSIDPTSFGIGSTVTINGTGFGTTKGLSIVSFGTTIAVNFPSWSDTQIQVLVPTGTVTGKLSVMVNGITSNQVSYTIVVAPKITGISPTSFSGGTSVTITGTKFGASRGANTVTFNTVAATTYTSWSDTKIVCKAPASLTAGSLYVTVNSIQSNKVAYTIVAPLETVLIPSGSFKMGNTGTFSGMTLIPEVPVHNVTISTGFYMSKYEITQALYTSVTGEAQWAHPGPDFPADRISWYDAVAFCNKLSDRDGYKKCYTISGTNVSCDWSANGWRLPTEAEWEYACKAGTSTDFYSGNNESDLDQIAWYSGNSGDTTHVGGLKKPNKFGVYDMEGNVFEWVWDWRGQYSGDETDPTGPSSGSIKIIRGGSWHNGIIQGMCRSSARAWEDTPDMHSSTDGIRVVRLQ